jgi:carbamoyl-phosphate synthase small subunit
MSETVKMLTRDAQGQVSINLPEGHTKAHLVIEDGTVLTGLSFGKPGVATGELVFNTSLTGYQEVLTDPSYAGQIITFTYPEIGNYGISSDHNESSKIYARGMVVRHLSRIYSNQQAVMSLDAFLKEHGIVGISEIDTRMITRAIRDKGAMRCLISTEHDIDIAGVKESLIKQVRELPDMTGQDLTGEVTTSKIYKVGNGKYKVAVMDFGCKQNILRELAKRDIEATVYPASTKAAVILESKPDGIFLSNGPGDPAACSDILAELPKLINSKIPIFGICLGHQLLSIAMGCAHL